MNSTPLPDPISSFSDLLRRALGDALRTDATTFLEMLADHVVMEFPYSPTGSVERLEGRPALARHLEQVAGLLEFDEMHDLVVHPSREAGVFVLEFGCTGRGVQTGEPYNQRYISVIRVREGQIVHYRDYWNPLIVLSAVGGVEALRAASGGAAQ
ncbi:nuclear transport factor 2 family protein [Enhygromyxa salina]|uniref:Putative PhzA/B-like protein n=1 Tax=Enhygromyxa salina TaxID=215803 RepID=A0A2S9YYL8_9BACT|nr:nuclear transport factor 2 family protein [Enhygromyxa salina]PRQ10195.1 putative PhzA/B-like protein [Enhygromyxa salina]